MKVKVYSLDGNVIDEIELPDFFKEEYRPDLIQRAFSIIFTHRLQPKGRDPMAGKRRSAESWGVGYGLARVPRLPNGRAAVSPNTVGGRLAHPPKVEKIIYKKINKKERIKATLSALAASINLNLVRNRGHRVENIKDYPIIVEDKLEEISKAKDLKEFFKKFGLIDDINRAKEKKIRSGKGKMRGRKYKKKKSLLIVVSRYSNIFKAANAFQGVDVVTAKDLSLLHLAPGGHAGRLTVFTRSAINELKRRFEKYVV